MNGAGTAPAATGGTMHGTGDRNGDGGPAGTTPDLAPRDFTAIAALMQQEARIALSPVKMTLVKSRLARRLRLHGLARYCDYVDLVRRDAEERAQMVVALTTNHTHFFREPHHFEHLREQVMPMLKRKAADGRPVRIWSAGCSSGEEVYTIAMTLLGADRTHAAWLRQSDVRLLATDISPPMVDAVTRGFYSEVDAVPEPYRARWTQPSGEGFVMADEARALVTARVLNLFQPWPLKAAYDVIFCRNVMIYFDDRAKAELEARFVNQLAPGGHLYIGHSERLLGHGSAHMRPCGQTIYRKEGGQ